MKQYTIIKSDGQREVVSADGVGATKHMVYLYTLDIDKFDPLNKVAVFYKPLSVVEKQ